MENISILIVEDDADSAYLINKWLTYENQNFHLESVDTLSKTLKLLSEKPFHLIILDLYLPDSEGLETFKKVNSAHPNIPIVVLSGLNDETLAIEAIGLGAQDYLIKSKVDHFALQRALKYALGRGRILEQWKKSWHDQYLLATHDALTGLPNRSLFQDRLVQSLNQAKRYSFGLGVLFADIDDFKKVNDTLGHLMGDHLLREVAKRFAENLRAGDTLARWGGDEFTAIIYKIKDAESILSIAHRILSTIAIPVLLGEQMLTPNLSIGISLFPQHGESPPELLQFADKAMYEAKKAGGQRILIYDPHSHLSHTLLRLKKRS